MNVLCVWLSKYKVFWTSVSLTASPLHTYFYKKGKKLYKLPNKMSSLIYFGVCDASTLPHPELHNP